MSLFQNTVLNKYLGNLDPHLTEEKYKLFTSYFNNPEIRTNILNSKEEQFQEGFLISLFVNILGYTINPNPGFNLITEFKNEKDSRKSDAAIIINNTVIGIIELKGTEIIDLTKIENQAFGYKNNHPEAVYVITSNFRKIRLYIDNAVNFNEFDLFNLTFDEFKILYISLSFSAISGGIPIKIKQESLVREENISRQLYNDYSFFKRNLFNNLITLNPQIDQLTLFKKTQKLLDRFLFIFFAEDRMLLPANSMRNILSQWTQLKDLDQYVPLYDRIKKFFSYLNTGYKSNNLDIFPYNGGLFRPDDVLDNILIDDDILKSSSISLSNYDFNTEIDVNILGHIFENSLNEIEEITLSIQGKEIDKSKTKRKKEGVFYTPKYITSYIVKNTLGSLCSDIKNELGIIEEDYSPENKSKDTRRRLVNTLDAYRDRLLKITICDPACGSGAFLNQALDYLINEHKYIDELKAKLLGESLILSDIETGILENNLFGVDINEESVEIAKLSLWLRTARKNRKLNNLSGNIKCGNSLIDDPAIAGEKAFNWHKEFPQVFANGGFDIIIGNPPYGVNFSTNEKDYLQIVLGGVPDHEIYIYFISMALQNLIRPGGLLTYIFPNTFLSNLFGINYRKHIFTNYFVENILDLSNDNTFEDASVRTCVFSVIKNQPLKDHKTKFSTIIQKDIVDLKALNQDEILQGINNILSFFTTNSLEEHIINKLNTNNRLSEYFLVSQGLIPYDKYRGHSEETIKNRIWHANYKKDDTYKKELKGGDVNRYSVRWNNELWISYGNWLAAPREKKYFINKRILVREITGDLLFCAYTDDEYYNTPSIINIINENDVIALKYALVILNSKLIGFYHNLTSPKAKKGLFPKILINDIRNIPIKYTDNQQPFIELADLMLSLHKELNTLKDNFLKFIISQFDLQTTSKKLDNWNLLDAKQFITELRKNLKTEKKPDLSKSDEFRWFTLFSEQKARTDAIQTQINQTDTGINKMVYELYGLSEEEIKIVEGKEPN
ncbi:MAG TPA: TaqI-like C-terminal specificity domain-containing protein [Ignavibacteriaceae bacterium]|mgnify:CR=1 FL=1|nr:TaqI-like C-terminal specificity domain-containing protein [Ignavibacteriaceae bacterium]